MRAVRAALARHRMVAPGDKVLVGVSGGPDSLALLHVLWRLRAEIGVALHVAHLNHLLRGEQAAEDAAFVRAVSEGLGLPCTVEEAPVARLARERGLSLEEAGRVARYDFFRRLAAATGAARVALGHTRDDQAETVLMRLLRGAGPSGLAGIPPVRDGWVIRPLLAVSRAAVEAYCRAHGLRPRRDPTNEEPSFLRNRVRLELLPRLESEYNPELRQALAQLAELLRAEEEWLGRQAEEAAAGLVRAEGGSVVVGVEGLVQLPLALRRRVVRLAAERAGVPGPLPFEHVEGVLALCEAAVGGAVSLPGACEARREHDGLVIGAGGGRGAPFSYRLAVPGSVLVPEAGLRLVAEVVPGGAWPPRDGAAGGAPPDDERRGAGQAGVAVLDADRLPLVLTVRSRRPGDRFRPLGMRGEKKLQDFLVDAKVPRRERDRVPVVEAGGEIVWVVGHRVDARFAAGEASARRLVLRAWREPAGG